MKTITISKAISTSVHRIESVTINIDERLPDVKGIDFYRRDAMVLADAFHDAIPQGTYDELICAMLGKRLGKTISIVSYRGKGGENA